MEVFIAFIRNFWQFLFGLALAIGIALIIFQVYIINSGLPSEIINARMAVITIRQSLTSADVEEWWAESQDEKSQMKFFLNGYELIVAEYLKRNSDHLIVYIKDGKKIAEDVVTSGDYAFARKYYREDCVFAIDYFDDSGRFKLLEYDEDCTGKGNPPEYFAELDSPVFLPPLPLFTYR
jgi:hypothetical protein